MNKVIVEGHRGYCAKYPENTLISFEAALDLGVDAIEFDIWLSNDKVPVLMHDGNCLKTCGVNKHLRDMTLAEIKELEPCFVSKFGDQYRNQDIKIPTFEELLELCQRKNPNIILGVEIKEYTEETVDLSVALLKKYGFFDTCVFYAFNARIIKYLKTKYKAKTMGYPGFQMQENCKEAFDYYDELGLSLSIVKSEVGDFYIEKGLPTHMFCADNEEDAKLCIEKGAFFVTANDPLPLIKVLREKGLR